MGGGGVEIGILEFQFFYFNVIFNIKVLYFKKNVLYMCVFFVSYVFI